MDYFIYDSTLAHYVRPERGKAARKALLNTFNATIIYHQNQKSAMKAVIFDMDGTIVDSEQLYYDTFHEVMKPLKIKISRSVWRKEMPGRGLRYVIESSFKKYHTKSKYSTSHWIKRWCKQYQKRVKEQSVPFIPGFLKFYKELKKHNIKVIIATGSAHNNVKAALQQANLNIPIVDCMQVKRCKPAPDLFLLAAKKLNIKPKDCIVFEDATSGIKAAKRAGMKAVALTTTYSKAKMKKFKPDLIVRDFKGVSKEWF